MSVNQSVNTLIDHIHKTIGSLKELWDKVYMDDQTRTNRMESAFAYMNKLLDDMVKDEQDMVNGIASDIIARRLAIAELQKIFGITAPDFTGLEHPEGSIALLKALDAEAKKLNAKREEAVAVQVKEYRKLSHLYYRLGMSPPAICENIENEILSVEAMDQMSALITEHIKLLEKRLIKVKQLQAETMKIYQTVDLPATSNLGDQDLSLLKVDFTMPNVIISQEIHGKLANLNQRLKDEYDQWLEKVVFRYDELIVRLDDISTKCFRPPISNIYPPNFDPDQQSERDLQRMEEELRQREKVYQRAQPVFDKMNEWMAAWKEKLAAERRVCRASFYRNRGGTLNTKLKQQRQLELKVPRLFNELHELVEEYLRIYDVDDILVEGMRPDEYAQEVMGGYSKDREVQRYNKVTARPIPNSPSIKRTRDIYATPSKTRVLHQIQPMHGGTIRKRKRSLSCSQISVITPVNVALSPQMPRTSSPKDDQSFTSAVTRSVKTPIMGHVQVRKTPSKIPRAALLTPMSTARHAINFDNAKSPSSSKTTSKQQKQRPWY